MLQRPDLSSNRWVITLLCRADERIGSTASGREMPAPANKKPRIASGSSTAAGALPDLDVVVADRSKS
jgi:hypothetical protein